MWRREQEFNADDSRCTQNTQMGRRPACGFTATIGRHRCAVLMRWSRSHLRVLRASAFSSALKFFLAFYAARRIAPREARSRGARQDLIRQKPGTSGGRPAARDAAANWQDAMHQFPGLPDGAEGQGAANPRSGRPVIESVVDRCSTAAGNVVPQGMQRGDPITLTLGAVAPRPLPPQAGEVILRRCRGAAATPGR
jgi:hypothetical protein